MSRSGRIAVVAAYFTAFWVALPAGLWLAARALDRWLGLEAPRRPAGWAAVAAGLGLLLWAIVALRREAGGLPVTALPPPRLATHGPYRLCRHPVYLGFDLAVLGAGLALGSPALAWIVAPLLLPAWMLYAAAEERGLERRFGDAWRSYRRRVGMLTPRFAIYWLAFAAIRLGALPCRVAGREHVPRRGGAVLVHNHASYVDFLYVAAAAAPRRPVYLVTSEAYRSPLARFLMGRGLTIPVRRYRAEPAACREVLRLLEAGHLVVVAPEAERATLGRRLRPLGNVARVLSRLGVPCVPVGISGAYDVGPRWAGRLRRRPVSVRVGPPVDLSGPDPAAALDAALGALVERDPQPVHLEGLDRRRLERVVWRCPRCLAEPAWRPAELSCGACGARWTPTADGLLEGPDGVRSALADVAAPVWAAAEASPLRARGAAGRERSMFGPIEPLVPLGTVALEVGPRGLTFDGRTLASQEVRSVGVERNDTLQVATREGMWQFRLAAGSVFRLELALVRWCRGAGR